jgi:hypothetical protein
VYSEIVVRREKKDGAVLWSQRVAVNDARPDAEIPQAAVLDAVISGIAGYFTGNLESEASESARAKEACEDIMNGYRRRYMAKEGVEIGEDADFDLIRVMFHAGSADTLNACKTVFAPPEAQKAQERPKSDDKIYDIQYILFKAALHRGTYPFIFGAIGDAAAISEVDINIISSPAFSSNWTHIVGAPKDLILFYDANEGAGVVERLNTDGTFTLLSKYNGFARDWTYIVPASNGLLLFYNSNAGHAATRKLDADGTLTLLHQYIDFARGWTHIVPAGSGLMLFYNLYKGLAATGRIEDDGTWRILRGFSFFNLKWIHVAPTHIASACNGIILFYDDNQGRGTTGRVNVDGTFTYLRRSDDFSVNWTHIVPLYNNIVLFYNSNAGRGITGRLGSNGTFTLLQNYKNLACGWTHIVPSCNGPVFFYNAKEGRSAIGRVTDDGACITLREF